MMTKKHIGKIGKFIVAAVLGGIVLMGSVVAQASQPTGNTVPLTGALGAAAHWGSGWIDLALPMDFQEGERLKITVGGTAEKVFVRLLTKGANPDTNVGVIGGAITVPASRIIWVQIPTPQNQIVQISVHGGPAPWNIPLGSANGPATLEAIARVK